MMKDVLEKGGIECAPQSDGKFTLFYSICSTNAEPTNDNNQTGHISKGKL